MEGQRKFLGTLWNTYSFYVLYAGIDKFDPSKYDLKKCKLNLMDKWLLSGLNSLVDFVDKNLAEYRILDAARRVTEFTDSLSNWYVRRCRERFWASGMDDDKTAAFMTLYTALKNLSKITAPLTPFISESIYQNIVKRVENGAPESVHLCEYPVADKSYIDTNLEKGMGLILQAAYLGRAARNQANIKTRQPLGKMLLASAGGKKPGAELLQILEGELNVKTVEFIKDASEYVSYEVKPQLKTLGPKYGAKLGAIRAHLAANGEKVMSALRSGIYSAELDGILVELMADDVLAGVINKAGFSAASEDGLTVVLDTTLDADLIAEGHMRELVSKIQTLRKESGFEVTDNIALYYDTADTEILAAVKRFEKEICADVLAVRIENKAGGKEHGINGKTVYLGVEKA